MPSAGVHRKEFLELARVQQRQVFLDRGGGGTVDFNPHRVQFGQSAGTDAADDHRINALPLTRASATFWCADSMILPNVWRETLIFSAAGSW